MGKSKRTSATAATGERVRQLPDGLQAVYREIVRSLPSATPADAAMIEQMAQALILSRKAFAELESGQLVETDTAHGNGQEQRRSPMWIAWRGAVEQLRAAAGELGATPKARSRIGPPPETDELTLAQILFEGVNQERG